MDRAAASVPGSAFFAGLEHVVTASNSAPEENITKGEEVPMPEQTSSTISAPRPSTEGVESRPAGPTRIRRSFAQYVREHDAEEMMADLERAARRRPIAAIVSAVLVGFVAGRILRR